MRNMTPEKTAELESRLHRLEKLVADFLRDYRFCTVCTNNLKQLVNEQEEVKEL